MTTTTAPTTTTTELYRTIWADLAHQQMSGVTMLMLFDLGHRLGLEQRELMRVATEPVVRWWAKRHPQLGDCFTAQLPNGARMSSGTEAELCRLVAEATDARMVRVVAPER